MKLKRDDIGVRDWTHLDTNGMYPGGQPPVISIAQHYPTGFFALAWDNEEKSRMKREILARKRLMEQLEPTTVEGKLKLAKALLRSCSYGLCCSDPKQVKEIRENVNEFLEG